MCSVPFEIFFFFFFFFLGQVGIKMVNLLNIQKLLEDFINWKALVKFRTAIIHNAKH